MPFDPCLVSLWSTTLAPCRFPGFFSLGAISHEGPSREQAAATKCITTLVARGYSKGLPPTASPAAGGGSGSAVQRPQLPDREVVLRITGPDPGYAATAVFLVQAGLTVLLERSKLPPPGVHTVCVCV